MMDWMQRNTDDLLQSVTTMEQAQLSDYLKENFPKGDISFVRYMDALIEEKGLRRQDILQRANLPQKYGYKLLSGETHTKDRDRLLRIFFAMELSLKQVQRALRLYGMAELYPKIARDVVLIVALQKKVFDVDEVNRMLQTEGFCPLYCVDEE